MPTAARLVAALSLALVAAVVSLLVMQRMTEIADFGYFLYVNIVLGLLVGWLVMGHRAYPGIVATVNNGITGAVVLVFWALLVQGGYEMVRLALNRRYHGPVEAIYGILENAAGYAVALWAPEIIVTLLAGGVLSAMATRIAARNWR